MTGVRLTTLLSFAVLVPASVAGRQSREAGSGMESTVPVEVVARAVSPATIEMGDEALERLVVTAPEGVTLEVVDREPSTGAEAPERLGAWRSSRSPTDQGEVVWTFTSPLTAWTEGSHRTPPITVIVRRDGQIRQTLQEGSLPFRVGSPLPADARVLRPAAPLLPEQPPPKWPGLLAVLPAMAAVGSGFAWLRRRGVGASPVPDVAVVPKADPVALETAMLGVDSDPARAVIQAAQAVRNHPRLTGVGVRDAHTTADVVTMLTGWDDLAAVEGLLRLADATKYAGHCPVAQEVVDAVAPLEEGFRRG